MVNRLQIQETRNWSQTKLRVINVNNSKIKNKKWKSDNLKYVAIASGPHTSKLEMVNWLKISRATGMSGVAI